MKIIATRQVDIPSGGTVTGPLELDITLRGEGSERTLWVSVHRRNPAGHRIEVGNTFGVFRLFDEPE